MRKVQVGMDPLNMLLKKNKKKKTTEIKKVEDTTKKEECNKEENKEIPFDKRSSFILEKQNFDFLKKFYSDEEFIRKNGGLLPCEKIENHEKASYKNDDPCAVGILILSKYRLIFKFQDDSSSNNMKESNSNIIVPLFNISKLTKDDKRYFGAYTIILTLKDSREVTFLIWNKDNLKFFGDLSVLTFQKDYNNFFSFSNDYLHYIKTKKNFVSGWDIYDPKKEFLRMKITEDHPLLRFSKANLSYSFCQSYPELLVVPKNTSDSELISSSSSREKERAPVLSYYFKSKTGDNFSIWRCSDLKTGTTPLYNNAGPKTMRDIISINNKASLFCIKPIISSLTMKLKTKKIMDNYENSLPIDIIECEIDDLSKIMNGYNKCLSYSQSNDM